MNCKLVLQFEVSSVDLESYEGCLGTHLLYMTTALYMMAV